MASRVPLGTAVERCKKLNICNTCTSVNHTIGSCPGLKKKKIEQILPFLQVYRACWVSLSEKKICSKFSENSNNVFLSTDVGDVSNFLLPVLSIKMWGHGGP